MPRILLVVVALLTFVSSGFSQAEEVNASKSRTSHWATGGESLVQSKQEIPFMGREELFSLLRGKSDFFFLDARSEKEFKQSHIPNARNMPFLDREAFMDNLSERDRIATIITYCNWDFRAYVSALELKKKGLSRVVMMYPHGLKGWEASGLPVAGELAGKTDEAAQAELDVILQDPSKLREEEPRKMSDVTIGDVRELDMRILKKKVEPRHIEASVGDKLILHLHAEEEDHWFVVPDFGVNIYLEVGETKTIEIEIKESGYFPYGCLSCCSRYQCQVKQAILADITMPPSFYGE